MQHAVAVSFPSLSFLKFEHVDFGSRIRIVADVPRARARVDARNMLLQRMPITQAIA